MAIRPVFLIEDLPPHFREETVEFTYCTGLADSQRRKSSENLHNSFLEKHPGARILEVSRFSANVLGQRLSAFNLMAVMENGCKVPVENAFQSSKVFENGGPYRELLTVSPGEAKKADCLRTSGNLKCFDYQGEIFPLEPKTYFYDWLYINALNGDTQTTEKLLEYDAFTDIVFNPQKSVNCQARTIAIYVSLIRNGLLGSALRSSGEFRKTVYDTEISEELDSDYEQISLF